MSKLNVLISGAGIAGPVCAFWLARAGIKATIIERAPSLRNAGQSIEIAGPSLEVVQKMALEEAVRAKGTKEAGLAFVDETNRIIAELPMEAPGVTFTSEFEILRGDLVGIFHEACRKDTEYIFGDYISSIVDQGDKVKVGFAKGEEREFDLIIVADGMSSRTRGLVFDDEAPVKGLGHCCSYFSIPYHESDGTWSRFYSAPGRQILLRPHGPTGTAAHLGMGSESAAGFMKLDVKGQKEMMHELFHDAGWEASRVLSGMDDCKDFYMTETAQVKVKHWSKGRVVLLGDSAFCPSPIAGVGTTLAIVGAYVLAGELAHHTTPQEALAAYETIMRPYVEKSQKLPPGIPAMACPQTKWGIYMLHSVMSFVTKSGVITLLGKLSTLWGVSGGFKLPQYIT
ncbi:MAG: hypothetical protein M1830_000239 [Pleopsidium flavum]|nr:MAG: hypothetical protein M1830_000239 [Pleopsidium flavum]